MNDECVLRESIFVGMFTSRIYYQIGWVRLAGLALIHFRGRDMDWWGIKGPYDTWKSNGCMLCGGKEDDWLCWGPYGANVMGSKEENEHGDDSMDEALKDFLFC